MMVSIIMVTKGTDLCRADWMMEGSGGDTTATRILGSCINTSRARRMLF